MASKIEGTIRSVQDLHDLLDPILLSIRAGITAQPVLYALRILLTVIILTRVATTISARLSNNISSENGSTPRPVPTQPYWLLYLGHWPQFKIFSQLWLRNTSNSLSSGVVGLNLLGRKTDALVSPDLLAQLPESKISSKSFQSSRRSNFFASRLKSANEIPSAISSYASSDARIKRLSRLLEQYIPSFITGNASLVDQEAWERYASTFPLPEKICPAQDICHSNLQVLVRNFSAQVLTANLLGRAFMDANSDFVTDFFLFTRDYPSFMIGLPYFVVPSLGPPAGSRGKCIMNLTELVENMGGIDTTRVAECHKTKTGTTGRFDDLGDVDESVWSLLQSLREHYPKATSSDLATALLELLFARVWHASHLIFWVILYLHSESNDALLNSAQTEAVDFIQVVQPPNSTSAFTEPARLNINPGIIQALAKSASFPTLQSIVLESARLNTEFEAWKDTTSAFILSETVGTETTETVTTGLTGSTGQRTTKTTAPIIKKYSIPPATRLYLAYGSTNTDTGIWGADADTFKPSRWTQTGATDDVLVQKQKSARKNIETIVDGFGMQEILLIVIGIISMYDIGSWKANEQLKHRGHKIVNGMGLSSKNIRVSIKRRKLESR